MTRGSSSLNPLMMGLSSSSSMRVAVPVAETPPSAMAITPTLNALCLQASGRLELNRLLGLRFKGPSLAGSLTSQVLFSKLGSGLRTTS